MLELPEGDRPRALTRITEEVSQLMFEVQRISFELRPSLLDDLGLPSALEHLCQRAAVSSGVDVSLSVSLSLEPGATVATTLFRCAQELLTNALRHAHARGVQVDLAGGAGGVRLDVRDDGIGLPPDHTMRGLGLVGVRERCLGVGGRFEIVSRDAGGRHIRLELPLHGTTLSQSPFEER